jgi:hypothetical protein
MLGGIYTTGTRHVTTLVLAHYNSCQINWARLVAYHLLAVCGHSSHLFPAAFIEMRAAFNNGNPDLSGHLGLHASPPLAQPGTDENWERQQGGGVRVKADPSGMQTLCNGRSKLATACTAQCVLNIHNMYY